MPNSISPTAGGDPYRRKVVTFQDVLDRKLGADMVKVKNVGTDKSPFKEKYDATSPAADASGYVKMPNVNPLVELMDMREAQRSYEANLRIVDVAKDMMTRTIDLLRN